MTGNPEVTRLGHNVLFADHPGVTRFSDSRTLDLLNERIVLISPIEGSAFEFEPASFEFRDPAT